MPCPAGTYSSATGQTSNATCAPCPPGAACFAGSTGYTSGSCPAGSACAYGAAPAPCAANSFAAAGATTCTACPTGTGFLVGTAANQTQCSCAVGYSIGAAPNACVACSAGQFWPSGVGGVCVNVPTLPTFANAVSSPAAAAASVFSYTISCAQPGFAGPTQTFAWSAATNSFAMSGPVACSACSASNFSIASTSVAGGVGGAGFVCLACAGVDANLVGAVSGLTNYSGALQCACANQYYSNGAATVSALRCSACPTGSTAAGSPTTCTCGPNFLTFGAAATLSCVCSTGYNQVSCHKSTPRLRTPARARRVRARARERAAFARARGSAPRSCTRAGAQRAARC